MVIIKIALALFITHVLAVNFIHDIEKDKLHIAFNFALAIVAFGFILK